MPEGSVNLHHPAPGERESDRHMETYPSPPAVPAATAAMGSGEGRRRKFLLIFKIAISASLLWLLFGAYDISGAIGRIGHISPGFVLLAVAAEALSICLAGLRWTLVLHAINIRLSFVSALPIVWIGLFFNQALPSNLGGDVVRVWRVFRRGSDLIHAIGSVMLDRVMALLGLVILVSACLPFAWSMTDDPLLVRTLMAIVALTLAGVGFLVVFERLVPLTHRLLSHALVQNLVQLSHDIRKFLLRLSASVPTVAISVLNHVVIVAIMYILAQGLGIDIGFAACLVLVPPVMLISLLPISYAGWGVREGAMVAAFGVIGLPPADALALSVIFGLVLMATALPGGLIWLATGNTKQS